MKKMVIIYVALIVIVILLALYRAGAFSFISGTKNPSVTIDGHTFTVIEAKTDDQKITGLSGRASLDQNTGMLFFFDQKGKYPFWMKQMKFPIDIIYIDDNKIVDDFENLPPATTDDPTQIPQYTPKTPANYVLEINAGLSKKYNIKVGDTVTFKNL